MKHHVLVPVLLATAAVLSGGCDAAKSSNPTSPSVAGPIAGVNITTPKLLEPAPDRSFSALEQPITLLIENSSTNGQRPVSYRFEIATDAEFGSKVFTREGVEPGGEGRTSLRLPDALSADRAYYWRAQAYDGANTSAFTSPATFRVVTPATLGVPVPLSPVGAAQAGTRTPQFVVRNASRSGPVGAVSYTFEVSSNEPFTAMIAIVTVPEGAGETRFTINQVLPAGVRIYWRVRAFDSQVASAWSLTQSFFTPSAPAPGPSPSPSPSPAPPPSGGWPTNGEALAAWTEQRYPERLVATSSLDERQNNMAFLRDRMIEAGICGGMDLALNLKRGGPEISIDFLTHRKNGTWVGVDIGAASKVYNQPMRLQWMDVGPDGVYPKAYSPRPSCK